MQKMMFCRTPREHTPKTIKNTPCHSHHKLFSDSSSVWARADHKGCHRNYLANNKGMVSPGCDKGQVLWFKCQKPGDYNDFNEQQNQSGNQECLPIESLRDG